MSDENGIQLEPGEFLYQSDQELFLVVTGETKDGYTFSVHGWREISEERLSEYLAGEHGKLHRSGEIEQIIEEEADPDTRENFKRLKELFENYEEDGESDLAEAFALDDT